MTFSDIRFNYILLNEKSHKSTLIYEVSYKNFMGEKPLRINFNEINGFIKAYDGIIYLVIFNYWLHNEIYNRIIYLISEKSGITNSINHIFARIRIDLYSSLPTEKILTFHNVIILIKSVVIKNKNPYYYNIFLEKGSCNDQSNKRYF